MTDETKAFIEGTIARGNQCISAALDLLIEKYQEFDQNFELQLLFASEQLDTMRNYWAAEEDPQRRLMTEWALLGLSVLMKEIANRELAKDKS